MDLDLETSTDCRYDHVEIFDGPTKTAPSLGKFCHAIQEPVGSKSNSLLIVFKTDSSQGGRGFHARYFMDCNTKISGLFGAIETPNFPDPYPHDRNCTWTIEAPMGNKINATFSHFDIEDPHHR